MFAAFPSEREAEELIFLMRLSIGQYPVSMLHVFFLSPLFPSSVSAKTTGSWPNSTDHK